MKTRLLRFAVRLYPRAWRDRYGAELTALLEDLPGSNRGWNTIWDLWKGAITMRAQQSRSALTLTAMFALAGLVAAAGFSFTVKDRYVSGSLVQVGGSADDQTVFDAVRRALAAEHLQPMIGAHNLYAGEPDALGRLRKDISVSSMRPVGGGGNRAFEIAFIHPDARTAQQVTRALVDTVLREQPGASILDEASLPTQPAWPNRAVIATLGLGAGSLVGFAAHLFRRHRSSVR